MTDWTWVNSTVVRVVDGDTIVAQLTMDIGFYGSVSYQQKLRLARINCPAMSTPAGKTAAAYTTLATQGVPLLIVTAKPYKYGGEWMAEVTLPDGQNLSDLLVSSNNAVLWDGHGPKPGG